MPDIDYYELGQDLGWFWIITTLVTAIIGLVITYYVIYFAVRNALRSHARWEYDGGVAGEDRRRIG